MPGKSLSRPRPSSLFTQKETATEDSGNPPGPCSTESTGIPGTAPKIDDASEDSGNPQDPSSKGGGTLHPGGLQP